MADHETQGETDEWYTPEWLFQALDIEFDLDPAHPRDKLWIPCTRYLTQEDDGLSQPWKGTVWLNPPYGGRNAIKPWLNKFLKHNNGIVLVPNRTATDWFQETAEVASALLFVRKKIKFIRSDLTLGPSPGYGNVLIASGKRMATKLVQSDVRGLRYK